MRQLGCAEILDVLDRDGIDPRETTFMGKMKEELHAGGDSMSLAAGKVWVQDTVRWGLSDLLTVASWVQSPVSRLFFSPYNLKTHWSH